LSRSVPTLEKIARDIVACGACPRLRDHCLTVAQTKVARFRDQEYWGKPVPGFGDPDARLLIVGLAPAAHGANRTGRMFTGDSSGDWLYRALYEQGFATQPTATHRDDGLRLIDCYITASARCAPPDNRPSPAEFDRCRTHLAAELELLGNVRVVLALGHLAHDNYLKAARLWTVPAATRPTFTHGGRWKLPNGKWLLDSYHPSRQNTNTGRLTAAMWNEVFRRAKEMIDG
jgi:uracil-DNA glycosylase